MVQTSGWDTASRHVSVHVLRSAEATEERQRNEHTVRPGGRKGKERKKRREAEVFLLSVDVLGAFVSRTEGRSSPQSDQGRQSRTDR